MRPAWVRSLGWREDLLAQVIPRENMVLAWKRVEANKGSAGVDGLSIEETAEGLKTQWPKIREELRSGHYGRKRFTAWRSRNREEGCENWEFRPW